MKPRATGLAGHEGGEKGFSEGIPIKTRAVVGKRLGVLTGRRRHELSHSQRNQKRALQGSNIAEENGWCAL